MEAKLDCMNVCEVCLCRTFGEYCETCAAWIDVALRVVTNAGKDGASMNDVLAVDPSLDEFEGLAASCVEHLVDLGKIVDVDGSFFLPNVHEKHESTSEVDSIRQGPVDRRVRCRVHSWQFLTDAGNCVECMTRKASERREKQERAKQERAAERERLALARREESARNELARTDKLRSAAERAAALVEQGTSTNTRRSYATSWGQWESFCRSNGRDPLACSQDDAVSLLLVWIGALRNEGLSVATIKARLAGVAAGYSDAGIDVHPTDDRRVRLARRGLARDAAERGERRKQAKGLSVDDLRTVVSSIPNDARGTRDRAFLLLAFSGMLRLDDICALRRDRVEFRDAGLVLHVARSKTDQAGKGAKIPVRAGKGHLCPVTAVKAWFAMLDGSTAPNGPIFRAVNRHGGIGSSALTERGAFEIFRSRGEAAGIEGLSGHSARVGAIKEASLVGASVAEIASVSRHKTASVVLSYIDDAHLFSGKDVFRGALSEVA